MGKQKDGYNAVNPTKRQRKKKIKADADNVRHLQMVSVLEQRWMRKVNYGCVNCLEEAYASEMGGTTGYVTDDDLIESSNGKLQRK